MNKKYKKILEKSNLDTELSETKQKYDRLVQNFDTLRKKFYDATIQMLQNLKYEEQVVILIEM